MTTKKTIKLLFTVFSILLVLLELRIIPLISHFTYNNDNSNHPAVHATMFVAIFYLLVTIKLFEKEQLGEVTKELRRFIFLAFLFLCLYEGLMIFILQSLHYDMGPILINVFVINAFSFFLISASNMTQKMGNKDYANFS